MTIEEVTLILGNPDSKVPSTSENDIYYYYFTANKSAMRSQMPFVLFDSSGKVKFASYGELVK